MSVPKLVALAATVALFSACGETPTQPAYSGELVISAASNRVVGSARGSGHAPCALDGVRCGVSNPDGGLMTFSFNARTYADGSVKGSAQVNYRDEALGDHIKMDIQCVRYMPDNPNRAWMLGYVTHVIKSTVPPLAEVGQARTFAVEDNGEGNGADPDLVTVVFEPNGNQIPWVCEGANDFALNFFFDNVLSFAPVGGNIQVRAPAAD